MSLPLTEMVAAPDRARAALEAALRQTGDAGERPLRVAQALRSVWPCSVLYGCALGGQAGRAVLDEAGGVRADWAGMVEADPGGGPPRLAERPGGPVLPGHCLASYGVAHAGRWYGGLALSW